MSSYNDTLLRAARIGVAAGLVGLVTALGNSQEVHAQNGDAPVILSGDGYAAPYVDNHPLTKVVTMEEVAPGDTVRLDSTYTDVNGHYELTSIMTSINNPNNIPPNLKVLGNPFNNQANIAIGVPLQDNYSIQVFDQSGKELLNSNIILTKGEHNLILNGLGRPGMKFVNVTRNSEDGKKISKSMKLIQTEASYGPASLNVTGSDVLGHGGLKMASISNEIIVKFIPVDPNYLGMTAVVPAMTQVLNYVLQQLSATHDFRIKPYTLKGEDINSLTLNFLWADGTTTQYSVGSDGFIHVQRQETAPFLTVNAIVTHPADTATYSLYQFFRKTNHSLVDTNYAQSPKAFSVGQYFPPDPTPLKLFNIPDTLELYLPLTQVPDPLNSGQYVRMDAPNTLVIMCSRSPGYSVKYIEVPELGRKMVHFQLTWDESTGNQWNQADLQTARDVRAIILSGYDRMNGKRAFPPDTTVILTSTNDPYYIYLQSQAFSQTANTQFQTGTNPGNGLFFTTNYSSNGKGIIDYSYSTYPNANIPGIFEEIWQQYTNANDPLSGNLVSLIRDPITGQLTPYAREMMLLIYTANQGTNLD